VATKLSQILALEATARAAAGKAVTEAITALGNPAVNGLSRTYQPREDGGALMPDESRRVQVIAEDVLRGLGARVVRAFDLNLMKDAANTQARADVVVDGTVLIPDVPAQYLLFLAAQLAELRKAVAAAPVLDPVEDWHRDEARGFHAATPRETASEDRVPTPLVLFKGDEHHPPQVTTYEAKVNVGTWTTTKLSGALTADRKQELLDRLDALRDAVQVAREEANSIEVGDRRAGQAVADYLFG
jgi:hypothetical protein